VTDLATAIETAHAAAQANRPPAPDPVVIDLVAPGGAVKTGLLYHAWMEDSDCWDGWAMYTDLPTAMEQAAQQYADDEYPYRNEPDDEECAKPGQLVWTSAHGTWHLAEAGKDTGIRITLTAVYGPAATGDAR
jgi:hypothetical protein